MFRETAAGEAREREDKDETPTGESEAAEVVVEEGVEEI
jgi:hypothetical protein